MVKIITLTLSALIVGYFLGMLFPSRKILIFLSRIIQKIRRERRIYKPSVSVITPKKQIVNLNDYFDFLDIIAHKAMTDAYQGAMRLTKKGKKK